MIILKCVQLNESNYPKKGNCDNVLKGWIFYPEREQNKGITCIGEDESEII